MRKLPLYPKSIYLFLLPSLAMVILFSYIPAFSAVYHAFFHWNGATAVWCGLDNFRDLLRDGILWESSANLMKLLLVRTGINLALPLFVALLIFNLRSASWRYWYRVLFVVPMAVPGMVGLLIWMFFYQYEGGILNNVLRGLGLEEWRHAWLGDPKTSLYAIMFMGFPWVSAFALLIYYAGLDQIPPSVFDAAELDGARGFRRFCSIDLPLLTPQIKLLLVLELIGGIQGFQQVLIMTNGGPGYSTMLPGLYMYLNAFQYSRLGYASAIGVLMFIVIMSLTILNVRYFKSHRA